MRVSYRKNYKAPMTLLEAVEASLLAATRHHAGVEEPPAAVLWTDADGQWQPVVKKLQERLPQLVVHGIYDPERRTGPAVWLKCIVGRTINLGLGKDIVPIVYLPNVSRQTLRAAGDCPVLLQPLVELQYRGAVWTQRNGKDWTVEAFLISDDGLGLDVSRDDGTRNSLHSALPVLAETPIPQLEGKRLEAEDFDKLMVGDQPRDLLEWMNDPKGAREGWGEGKWHAFRSRCKKEYGFDPDAEGAVGAAERLGLRKEAPWQQLWDRFSEAPVLYKALPDLLTRAKPSELVFNPESWPDENDKAEARLRTALLELATADGTTAREAVLKLEAEHSRRRNWVWAKMGRSPQAQALEILAALASKAGRALNGASLEEIAKNYENGGYEVDLMLVRVLGEGKSNQDRAAIQAAARAAVSSGTVPTTLGQDTVRRCGPATDDRSERGRMSRIRGRAAVRPRSGVAGVVRSTRVESGIGPTLGRHSDGDSHGKARRIAGGRLVAGRTDFAGQFHAIHQDGRSGVKHGAVPQIAGGRRLSIPRRWRNGRCERQGVDRMRAD